VDDRHQWDLSPDPVAVVLAYLAPHSAGALVREAFYGTRRFDDFVSRTGLTRSAVAHRLRDLVATGVLEQVAYQRPGERERRAYQLSAKGRDLAASVVALARWSQSWLPPAGGPTVVTRHRCCGAEVGVSIVCAVGHHDLTPDDLIGEPGPGARPITPPTMNPNLATGVSMTAGVGEVCPE